ncbi:MAG: hypothetical protein DMF95_11885 [Acidobacteria bacterium]|nr:MAG: hypothetical protein DMF95_11885 [Acidobacteriota bacterium]
MLLALTLAATINAKPAESAENVRLCALYALRVHTAYQTPQPFPRPGQPAQPPTRPAPTAPAPAGPAAPGAAAAPQVAPTEANLGVPIFPGAQFIASYDAGRGQRYYIFGSAASFVELVAWYRTVLKQKGELVYDVPATHEFDVGKFHEETMAFPPGVTIKDFQSDISQGYPNPKPGGQPARFPTLIQVVPVMDR